MRELKRKNKSNKRIDSETLATNSTELTEKLNTFVEKKKQQKRISESFFFYSSHVSSFSVEKRAKKSRHAHLIRYALERWNKKNT